jgi:hypothetical protein
MIKLVKIPLPILLLLFGLSGCKTYFIPVDSFKKQFEGIDSTNLRLVNTRGPVGDVVQYLANPIDYIQCEDKAGIPYSLKNGPSIEVRFTQLNGKRTIFYFDRIFLQDTLVIGERSRFLGLQKGIPINTVKLIEVQDGQKNYHYVEPKNK